MTLDEMIAELNEFRRKHPEAGEMPVVTDNREGVLELGMPELHCEFVSNIGERVGPVVRIP